MQPPNSHTLKLHVFCDTSERAYSAVAHLQGETKDGEMTTSLVASKSRVMSQEDDTATSGVDGSRDRGQTGEHPYEITANRQDTTQTVDRHNDSTALDMQFCSEVETVCGKQSDGNPIPDRARVMV